MTYHQRVYQVFKTFLGLATVSALLILTLLVQSASAEKPDDKLIVGLVSTVEGTAEAQAEGETTWEKLAMKDDIYLGDTIRTKANSKVKLTFKDDSAVSLGPDASLQLKQFEYVPEKDQRVSTFTLSQGKARAIVGRIFGSNSKFEIETPTAVAGVRGTYFIVWVLSSEITKVFVLEGKVTVRNVKTDVKGEVEVTQGKATTVEEAAPPGAAEKANEKELQEGVKETKAELDTGIKVSTAKASAPLVILEKLHADFIKGLSTQDTKTTPSDTVGKGTTIVRPSATASPLPAPRNPPK